MLAASPLEQLRQKVEAETGMDLAESRFPRFQAAVERILAQRPGVDLDRLMARADEHAAFLENLTAELTVGESFFFRNEGHFRALREQVLPDIFRANAAHRQIRIWSAGCATGEEPYSLSILLDQQLADGAPWRTFILGTDLNLAFLERARQARYRQWSFRQTDIHQDRRYFSSDGEWSILSPRLREHVRFAYLNLVKDVYPSALTGTLGLDLIVFRNVAIYLKPEVTKAIIERFRRALRPGGWLLLGEVELSLADTQGFEARQFEQATFFQKPAGSARESEPYAPLLLPNATGAIAIPSAPMVPAWGPLPWKDVGKPGSPADKQSGPAAKKTLWDQVERCLYLGEFAEAERVLEGCLREDPLLLPAQLLKAGFAEEAGDLAAAEQAYRRALYIDRHCALAHFHLALVLKQRGLAPEARRSLETTLQLIRDKNPQTLVEYGEGICYGRLLEMATLLMRDAPA